MELRALNYICGLLAMSAVPLSAIVGQCPEGRTLKRQFDVADLVVYGELVDRRDCLPIRADSVDPGMVAMDCEGQELELRLRKTWKGPAQVGQTLLLSMPPRNAPDDIRLREGGTHVVFAKLFDGAKAPTWLAETNSCMLPEVLDSSGNALVKELDRWLKRHKS